MDISFLYSLADDDIGFGDISSSILPDTETQAMIYAKEDMCLAGTGIVRNLFSHYGVSAMALKKDGENVKKNEDILSVSGDAKTMLALERTALNIMQRMSGIATSTRHCIEIVRGMVIIAGTRKTLLPYFDKKAIQAGGGDPHRWRLDDMIMIKDNHIDLMGITASVQAARKISFTKKIEVEVRDEKEAVEASEAGADIIMFDNMSPDRIRGIMERLPKAHDGTQLFEASGNITPDTLRDYADCGIDIVSMGWLTHSVQAADISLRIIG